MIDDSFDLELSDSESTKKLFDTSTDTTKLKSKEKIKSNHDSYSLNSSNYSLNSKKSILHNPKPYKFSHVFITIHKYERLFKCQMQTLFARIRFHPKISIIQTNNSMCISDYLDFNCSYSLDFRSIPPFQYEDITPVVELYRRIPNHSELVGISLLPLKVIEQVKIQKKTLTYFYHNSRVQVKDIMIGNIVGTLVISIAFGFQEHQPLFDPNIYKCYTSENQTNFKVNPTNNQIEIENEENDNEEDTNNSKIPEKKKRRNKHSHHHHRHKKKNNQWQKIATAAGWKPPNFVGSEWKTKALQRGWIPPCKELKSSIGINCIKEDIVTKESISTQYDPILLVEIENKNVSNSSTFSEENHNSSNDELEDIINILNPKSKRKRKNNILYSDSSQLTLTSPSTIFQKELPKLCATPVIQLLNIEAEPDIFLSESSDSSDALLNSNVNHIINNVLNCQKNSIIQNSMPQKIESDDQISFKKEKKKSNYDIYSVSSDALNDKDTSNSDTSSGSSSTSNVKKCLSRMDDGVKKILDIYGIESDFF